MAKETQEKTTYTPQSKKVERTDFDGVLKGSIRAFAGHVIQRLLPKLYDAMDHTKKIRFLDKELLDTLPGAKPHQPSHFVDCLLDVPLKTGKSKWVLLHIEIQGPGGKAKISVRMLDYCSLIRAHYHKVPVALLLLTSPHNDERTDGITEGDFGTELSYHYNCINIETLDEQELYNSDNLGDLILYSVKRVVKLNRRRNPQRDKLKSKVLEELGNVLYKKHWNKRKAKLAAELIWRLFNLPEGIMDEVLVKWEKEGNKVSEFMTHLEQRGFDRGEAKGKAEGKIEATIEMIRKLLVRGFSLVDIADISGMSLDDIRSLQQSMSV